MQIAILCKYICVHGLTDLQTQFCWKWIYMYVLQGRMSEVNNSKKILLQVYATCYIYCANKLVCTVLTDLQTRFCWKLIYMYVIRWCMSEIIDLTKNSISNCNLRQLAIFCKYICAHCFDWSTTYIMSIIVSNWEHCDEQQFQTLSCVHYTIFSVVKSDLFIRALLLDRILVTEKNTRTPHVHLVLHANTQVDKITYIFWIWRQCKQISKK